MGIEILDRVLKPVRDKVEIKKKQLLLMLTTCTENELKGLQGRYHGLDLAIREIDVIITNMDKKEENNDGNE